MPKTIQISGLEKWATKKFIEHYSTMELMASVENSVDLEAIAIVALMEVDPSIRYQGMEKQQVEFIKSCHKYLSTVINNKLPTGANGVLLSH